MSQILSQLLSQLPNKPRLAEATAARGEPNDSGYYHANLTKKEIDRLEEKFHLLDKLAEQMMHIVEDLDASETHDDILHDMEAYKLHHILKKAGHTNFNSLRSLGSKIADLHEQIQEMHMGTMMSLGNKEMEDE